MAESRRFGQNALPNHQHRPCQPANDEDNNGGCAVPRIVSNGGLVDDEDGQDSAQQHKKRAEIIEQSIVDFDKELVIFWPYE